MDKAKEQGLNVIHRRQQRAIELRQRIDRCDRLEPSEIDNLRHDIKQFVTDRRYDLGEELTSAHRFDYEQSLVEALKHFGTVLTCDRKRSISTTSPLLETSTTTENSIVHTISENVPVANSRKPSISPSSNEVVSTNQQQQPMEQRIQHKTNKNDKRSNGEMIQSPTNENGTGDYHQNYYYSSQTNGYSNYYDDSYNYQNMNRRRLAQQYPSSASQRPRPLLDFQNGNYRRTTPKQINTRSNMYNNSETTTAYHRPRPSSQSIVPVQT
ncbi:hypothetical protein I4U23_000849 [Adineta vaga]|nr:hypothetical protein I4U23_000849 [Adineta vaga]